MVPSHAAGWWFSVKAALNITVIKNNEKNKIYLFRVAFSVDYNPVYNMSFLSEFKRLLYMMPNHRFRRTIRDYNNLCNAAAATVFQLKVFDGGEFNVFAFGFIFNIIL